MTPSRTLDQIHSELWSDLGSAPGNPDHGWRLPVLATTDENQPHARTVVLREADKTRRLLTVHTDSRSPKVTQLAANPLVNLVFYDGQSKQQLVVSGTATIHTSDEIADANWTRATPSSRRGYLAPLTPGTKTLGEETNLPAGVGSRIPTADELAGARPNFAVIVIAIESIDWLMLERHGNARAVFRYDGDVVEPTWLAP